MAFRVGVTRDFLKSDGSLGFGDIGLRILDAAPGVEWSFLEENATELLPDHIVDFDALLVLAPHVTQATLAGSDRLKIIARFGVGYDSVDVGACTQNGVLLTITPDGVRRPVAVSAITLLLAISHKLVVKDRITREGRWSEKLEHMGQGLTGRTLGVIGLGNIGQEVLRLAAPFDMRHIGNDPYVAAEDLSRLDVELMDLEELLSTADYVVLCCALVPATRHLINADRLRLMRSGAMLINVARGAIVDQQALTAALQEQRIQGAALDVFEKEPVDPDDPILKLENVIVAPHSICWTDELFAGIGRDACQSLVDTAEGRVPKSIVNVDVLQHQNLRASFSPSNP